MIARTARLVLLAFAFGLSSCATLGSDDPIVGCWQRNGDQIALLFEPFGRARQVEREGSAIDYIFADVTWRRTGEIYRVRYEWPNRSRSTTFETARLVDGRLTFEPGFEPYERASAAQCGDPLPPSA